tara:strand:- start:220 stop:396 length:177 start_codon:yes stop_codon:yes gene_type:complete
MAEETKYDKQAKNLRYRSDKEGFRQARWEQLEHKEKDYWRGRVQQWSQDRSIHAKTRV